MSDEFLDFVEDILDAMDKVELLLEGVNYDRFEADFRINFAVVRALEIIGEASKRLPDDLRKRYPAVPWKGMAGMRDRIVHRYDNVDWLCCIKTNYGKFEACPKHAPKRKPNEELLPKRRRPTKTKFQTNRKPSTAFGIGQCTTKTWKSEATSPCGLTKTCFRRGKQRRRLFGRAGVKSNTRMVRSNAC